MLRFLLLLLVFLSFRSFSQDSISINLKPIGHLSPKGRVQDKEYNPHLPIIDSLIRIGPPSIPILVSKITDTTIISADYKNSICDFWDTVRVGDIAYLILCDFFTTSDWNHSTIKPGLWDLFRDKTMDNLSAYQAWQKTIRKYGRNGIKLKIETVLKPFYNKLLYKNELCFRVISHLACTAGF